MHAASHLHVKVGVTHTPVDIGRWEEELGMQLYVKEDIKRAR